MAPNEFLRVGSSICITLMGFADALIFSLREKPWRGIEGSDGTFWGSLVWTRRLPIDDIEDDARGGQTRPSVSGSGRHRGSQSYRTSASGDFARIAAEQARQRLDLEREERLKALDRRSRKTLRNGSGEGGYNVADDREEQEHGGLNVGDGAEGQVYDDNGLEDDTIKA